MPLEANLNCRVNRTDVTANHKVARFVIKLLRHVFADRR